MENLTETLKSTYLFEDIEDNILLDIANISAIKSYSRDEVIIKEDEENSFNLYILLSGKVEVFAKTIDLDNSGFNEDNEITYSVQNKNIFGEMSCIVKRRRSASVKASFDSKVIEIDGIKFMEYLENNKDFGFKILNRIIVVLVDKLNDANFKLKNHYLF